MIRLVINNQLGSFIEDSFRNKEEETYRIFSHYVAEATSYFMSKQGGEAFWTNHTFKAMNSFFSKAFARKGELVLGFYYDGSARRNDKGNEYTQYLEGGHEGRFAALPSIVNEIAPRLIADLKRLYGDAS